LVRSAQKKKSDSASEARLVFRGKGKKFVRRKKTKTRKDEKSSISKGLPFWKKMTKGKERKEERVIC